MFPRVVVHLIIGLSLTGCTVTNNLSTSYLNYDDSLVTLHTTGNAGADVIELISKSTVAAATPQSKAPKQKVEEKPEQPKPVKNSYCDQYEPLAVPDPIELDEAAYDKAMKADNEVLVRQILAKNIIDINIQIKDYRKNLKKHHTQWRKTCNK